MPSSATDAHPTLKACTTRFSSRRSAYSAGPGGATDALPAPKALPSYRQHPRSPSRTLPCSQWGLKFAVGHTKNQSGSDGGAKQCHGRPPDSKGVPDKVQPKKKRLFGGPGGATDAPPAPKALPPFRRHPRSPSRALLCCQWGLQFTVLWETQLQVPFYPPFLLSLRKVWLPQLRNTTIPR